MSAIKKLQDIHIEPLNISYVGSRDVISTKNKRDLLKILNKYQVFDNQLFKEGLPSISSEKATLLLQVYHKKIDRSNLDDLSADVLARKVNKLAQQLLISNPKSLDNTEIIDPFTDTITLSVAFALKFIHSFENTLLSSSKVGSSASSFALISDAVRNYKSASKASDNLSTRFALFQGLYGTLQSILGVEALSLTFINLIESNSATINALAYIGALSGVLTVSYLNIRSAFALYRHNSIMSPITSILNNPSISEKPDEIAQYLRDKVSITSEDIENTYKYALQSHEKDSHPNLLPKAEKYISMVDQWYDKNSHKLLNGLEKDPIHKLEILESPFKIALANELVAIYENKIAVFQKYMGSKVLKHIQSNALSNEELLEVVLKESKSFNMKQYVVIVLSILALASLTIATITTGGLAIGASCVFIGILALVAYSDITNLLSKLKDHILTEKEKLVMKFHITFSLLILAATMSIGFSMGAAAIMFASAAAVAILPIFLYAYILWEANRQLDKQASESAHKILSNSL